MIDFIAPRSTSIEEVPVSRRGEPMVVELWAPMLAPWPSYDVFQQRAERRITVIVLERTI